MSASLAFGQHEWDLAYRVALRVLRTPDQAEDAAQDALMSAYVARETFAGRSRPDSWLYRIAFNTALSHLRRPFNRRYASDNVFDTIDARAPLPINSPERTAMAVEIADSLGECLMSMRPADRLAFTERFILGTSEKELGQLLGVSTNAAKQRAFRARRSVRGCFQCRHEST